MFESLFVYTLLFLVMYACGKTVARREFRYAAGSGVYEERGRFFSREMWILVLAFALIFGCRWGVGRDYFRYLLAYTGMVPERFEFLFQSLTLALKKTGLHFCFYFGLWALLDIVLLYYALRQYKFLFPFLAFFLIFGSYYLPMMNAIRQYLAALVFLNAIPFIIQRDLKRFSICLVVAVLLHKLSVILFVIYPILRYKDDWFRRIWVQLALYFFAVFISFHSEIIIRWVEMPFEWLSNVLGYHVYHYEALFGEKYNRAKFGNNTGLGIWVKMFVTLPVIVFNKPMKRYYNSVHFNMLYTLYFVGVISSLLFGQSIVLNRVAMFFSIYQLIIQCFFVYFCFHLFPHRIKRRRQLVFWLGIMVMAVQIPLFLNMISNPNSTAAFLFFWQ